MTEKETYQMKLERLEKQNDLYDTFLGKTNNLSFKEQNGLLLEIQKNEKIIEKIKQMKVVDFFSETDDYTIEKQSLNNFITNPKWQKQS